MVRPREEEDSWRCSNENMEDCKERTRKDRKTTTEMDIIQHTFMNETGVQSEVISIRPKLLEMKYRCAELGKSLNKKKS